MQERRALESFTVGLTEDQIMTKRELLKRVEPHWSHVDAWMREMAVDFVVRCPDEAQRVYSTKEWETETMYSMDDLQKKSRLSNKTLDEPNRLEP